VENGGKVSALFVGYFKTEKEAATVRKQIERRFPGARVVLMESPTGIKEPFAVEPETGVTTKLATEETLKVDSIAEQQLKSAKVALQESRFRDAVDLLNQTLLLPPNAASRDAQELIGQGWEGLKQNDKARIEYQLYLKIYPNDEGTERVAKRLAAISGESQQLSSATAVSTLPVPVPVAEEPSKFSYTGSISQFYFGGQTKSESLVNIAAGIDQNTLSFSNQSALVTSLDFSGRYQSPGSEVKIVLRETASKNFITTSNAASSLNAAYVDYRNTDTRLDLRVGRQSSIAGSLFGIFDGVSAGMPFGSNFKLDAMAGVPANTLVSAPAQSMAGVVLEIDNLVEHWNGNVSLVNQNSEGISDRRAIGLDVRYFGDGVSAYTQLDYDLNFEMLNAATFMGSIQGPSDTTITFLLDDRKAPSLQLSDALISSGSMSLSDLLHLRSLSEVKALALGTAAQARQGLISVSRAISPKWQASIDLRYSDIGALPAIGDFQAMPATGAQYNVSLQLTGNNLYSNRDINGINISALTSNTLNGYQLAYNNLTGIWGNKASIEPSIRLYTQTDNTDTRIVRISPGLRMSYKLSERTNMLGEVIFERSQTDGPQNHDQTSAAFFYFGYRHDIF
jgi:tetratricopeptide (TPR) repeat protein